MIEILNVGLKFAILPVKLDITQVLVDFRKYEGNLIWKDFFFGKEDSDKYKPPIFKLYKTNLPKNHKTQEGLKTFIGATKSEILDPRIRNKVSCNVSQDHVKAIKELINLQKQQKNIIKRCDNGAGIIILEFQEYMNACFAHLNSEVTNNDGTTSKYYMKVQEEDFKKAKLTLEQILQEAFDNNLLSKTDFESMQPKDKGPGRFYCTLKYI